MPVHALKANIKLGLTLLPASVGTALAPVQFLMTIGACNTISPSLPLAVWLRAKAPQSGDIPYLAEEPRLAWEGPTVWSKLSLFWEGSPLPFCPADIQAEHQPPETLIPAPPCPARPASADDWAGPTTPLHLSLLPWPHDWVQHPAVTTAAATILRMDLSNGRPALLLDVSSPPDLGWALAQVLGISPNGLQAPCCGSQVIVFTIFNSSNSF